MERDSRGTVDRLRESAVPEPPGADEEVYQSLALLLKELDRRRRSRDRAAAPRREERETSVYIDSSPTEW